jgi:hypothetical protein
MAHSCVDAVRALQRSTGRGRYWRWADGSGVDDDKPVNQMEGLDLAREAFVVLIRSG